MPRASKENYYQECLEDVSLNLTQTLSSNDGVSLNEFREDYICP